MHGERSRESGTRSQTVQKEKEKNPSGRRSGTEKKKKPQRALREGRSLRYGQFQSRQLELGE